MPKKKKFKGDTASLMRTFSNNLMGLKFMQRAIKVVEKNPIEDYQSDEEIDDSDDDNRTRKETTTDKEEDVSIQLDSSMIELMKTKRKCIINPSYQFCERLKFGRLSFQGMNSDIESIMARRKGLDISSDNSATTSNAR